MIWYVVVGVILFVMLLYIVKRKPVWIEQITPSGNRSYICSHCGEIWTPILYSGFQLGMPPSECPNCNKEMRVRH